MKRFILCVALFAAACDEPQAPPAPEPAPAAQTAGAIQVLDAWAAETPNAATVAGVYLSLGNTGDAPDRLISASSPRAARTDLHEMRMEGDLMAMRAIPSAELAPHSVTLLAPGGFHLMLTDIDGPLRAGQSIPLTLRFERAGEITLEAPVRARDAGSPDAAHAGHAH